MFVDLTNKKSRVLWFGFKVECFSDTTWHRRNGFLEMQMNAINFHFEKYVHCITSRNRVIFSSDFKLKSFAFVYRKDISTYPE